jgi:pilus assembly protein CpaB
LTVAFSPERALGGQVEPGDSVGVLLSFEPFDITASTQEDPTDAEVAQAAAVARTPKTTHLTLDQILVTGVQFSQTDAERTTETRVNADGEDEEVVVAADINEAPGDQLLVTLAVTSAEAEQLVFTAEFGNIWLTGQNPETDEGGTRILTLEQVYVAVPR